MRDPATVRLTLLEALRKLGPPELWKAYEDARRVHKSHAGSGRIALRSTWIHGSAAEAHNAIVRVQLRAHEQVKVSRQQLEAAFRQRLISERWRSFGAPSSPDAEFVEIRPENWRYMRVRNWDKSIAEMDGDQPKTFYHVWVAEPEVHAAISSAKAETDCKAWLIAEMCSSLDDQLTTKSEYRQKAMAQFKNLSGRAFDRDWAAAKAETRSSWGRAGRPSKSSHPKSPRH